MEALWQDIRFGVRMLRKSPGFTAAALVVLALGIGANSAIFSVVNAVILRPLPYRDADRLVILQEFNPQQSEEPISVSYSNFVDWRNQSQSFDQMAAIGSQDFILSGGGEPERVQAATVTDNLFESLGVAPIIGRAFSDDEEKAGGAPVALISYGLWQRRFGANPDLSGKTISLDDATFSVIGVMPSGFQIPSEHIDVWMPLVPNTPEIFLKNRAIHVFIALARLKPGVTLEQSQTEMSMIAGRIQQQYPDADPGHAIQLKSLHEVMVGTIRPSLFVLFGAVVFVLAVACANVVNLMFARAASRQKELAIRTALGAVRLRIIRQLLTESLLLAFAGGGLGLLLALWGVDWLVAGMPDYIPRSSEIGIDSQVLGFTFLVSLLTGAISGTMPAFQASRPDLNEVLKEGGRASASFARSRTRNMLVVAEIALSLVLLIGAGLMIDSFRRLQKVNPGFRADNLLTMEVSLPNSRYPNTSQVISFYKELPQKLKAIPGVEAASAVNRLPISGGDSLGELTIEGRPFPSGEAPSASYRRALPNYFQTMGIPLIYGREFDARDNGETKVVLINGEMARRYWPDKDAVGKRIKIGPPEGEPWLTIVGVVGDVKNTGLSAEPALATYEPHAQRPWSTMNLVVRTAGDPMNLASTIRDAIRATDQELPVLKVSSMEKRISASVTSERFNTLLMSIFAGVALMLAAVGVYAVMSYTVNRRTHEIGVRMALGARRRDVVRLIVGQAVILVLAGVAIGLIAAFFLTRLMSSLLFQISPTDPAIFAAVALILLGVALGASFIPVRRAMKVDPMVALRCE